MGTGDRLRWHFGAIGERMRTRSVAPPQAEPGPAPVSLLPALAYAFFLVYGSLYPWSGWASPPGDLSSLLLELWPRRFSRTDIVTNLAVYVPLGFLTLLSLRTRFSAGSALVWTCAAGLALSGLLECGQAFLPTRTSSASDWLLNGTGTLLGACAAKAVGGNMPLGRALRCARRRWVLPGRGPEVGLAALGVWALSQLIPFVPSLDVGMLKHGVRPVWQTWTGTAPFDPLQSVVYFGAVFGLGLVTRTMVLRGASSRWLWAYAAWVLAVLLLKVPVMTQQLSAEAVLGALGGLVALRAWNMANRSPSAVAGTVAVAGAYVVEQLRAAQPASAQTLHEMNWIPFRSHALDIFGVADLLGIVWPFVALAFLTRPVWGSRSALGCWGGAVPVFTAALVLELLQQRIPGRVADVTDAIFPALAWFVASSFTSRDTQILPENCDRTSAHDV